MSLFRVRRFTQTQNTARLWANTANGCLVARTLSSTLKRTEKKRRSEKWGIAPLPEFPARRTAVVPLVTASDELNASYPFSAPPNGTTASSTTHPRGYLLRSQATKTKAESERRVRHLTFTYHGCPYVVVGRGSPTVRAAPCCGPRGGGAAGGIGSRWARGLDTGC